MISLSLTLLYEDILQFLGYVWFSENLRKNAKERKYKGKIKGKKK